MSKKAKIYRILFLILFVVLMIHFLPKIEFDNSLERWMPPASREIADYKDFLNQFGGDALLVIVFHDSSGFKNEATKNKLNEFQQQLKTLPDVKKVFNYPLPLYRLKRHPNENIYTLVVTFTPPSHLNPNRPELIMKVQDLLKDIPIGSHLAGTGVLHQAINDETQKYTFIFLTIGMLFLMSLLLFVLKNARAFLLSIGISIGGVLTMLISSAMFKIPLSMITVILPVLVLFYGTSSSLHILFHQGNFKQVLLPCLLASCTTAIGFLVFLVDPIPLLIDFAVLAIAGIVGGLMWAFIFFFPQIFYFQPQQPIVQIFQRFPIASKRIIFLIFLGLMVAMIPGILKVKAEIYSLDVLSPSNQRVVDHHFIEKNVGNYLPLEYTVELGKVSPIDLNHWISSVFELDEIDGVLSYTHFLPFLDARSYGYISKDGKNGRITFLIPILSTTNGMDLVRRIDSISEKILSNYQPKINGYVTLYAIVADELKRSFIESLLIAFVLVFLVMFIYLRNFKLFFAAILPNVFPIVFIIGLMGWLKISLNMVTVPIGCLLLGIIVDDTIHFLFWYKKTGNLRITFIEAGPGIFLTTLILVVGFSVFIFAAAPPIKYFGILSIVALITGVIGDTVLLPIMLKIFDASRSTNSEASLEKKER